MIALRAWNPAPTTISRKPFSPKELVLRVESILRRVSAPNGARRAKLHIGDIHLDSETHRVTFAGQATRTDRHRIQTAPAC